MAKNTKTALDMIRDVHGSGAVFGGNESVQFSVSATSSGSLNLDEAIGCGGIPDGRLILWSGPESSGKTLGALCFAKKKQQEGKRILFIDAECTWDHTWASSLGLRVDPDWMLIAQESGGCAIFDLLCGKSAGKKRKNSIPGILSDDVLKQMEAEGTPLGAIILDSINAVVPPLEMNMETGDQQIGSLSRFLPPMLRRLTPLLKRHDIPMLCICQARTNIGQIRGDPLTVSGGRALMHGASLWLDSRKISNSNIFANDDSNEEKPIGHQVRTKVRKNKVGPPGRKAEVTIYYTKGIDLRPELLEQGIARGIIRYEGNSLYYSAFEGGKVVGKNNALTIIFNDKKVQKRLLNDIVNHRTNADREAKRNSEEFVDEEEENVVIGQVNSKFQETEKEVKLTASSEVKSKVAVQPDGTRIDADTGEVIERELEMEQEPIVEEVPQEDPEAKVASVDDSDETTENVEEITTVHPSEAKSVGSGGNDYDNYTFKQLKDAARDAGIKGWYKMSTDELRENLKKL